MKTYNFLKNVSKHIEIAEEKQKKVAIGSVVHSLQRPFQELVTGLILEQRKQVDELLNNLGWQTKSSTLLNARDVEK